MSQDAQKTKALVEFKERLEKKIEELQAELREVQATLEIVNSIVLQKGFKRAEISRSGAEKPEGARKEETAAAKLPDGRVSLVEYGTVTELKAANGEFLADLYSNEYSLRVVLAGDKDFGTHTPPFMSFLVERVLAKMEEKDRELVTTGKLSPEMAFSYEITKEGDVVREIVVNHVDEERMKELKSSIRWTLEKMYEKMQAKS